MRVIIVGANGQLGSELVKVLSDWSPRRFTRDSLDIRDARSVEAVLSQAKAEVVVNAAAYNRVDDSEDDPDKAFSVNAYGARNLARVCADLDCALMHISTDYVFGGEQRAPYTERDPPDPLNVYGVSKLAGEIFVRNTCSRHFVVRTCGLYGVTGSAAKGGNFVDSMIRLARERRAIRVVDDQVSSPTSAKDLAEKLRELLQTRAYGLYHITNGGQCSWYEFAGQIFKLAGLKPDVTPVSSEAYGAKARRPRYSVLAAEGLKRIGLDPLRSWTEALRDYLSEKGHLGR
jgi:dTDP-4-dehydrorhamnose reductase